MRTNTNTFKNDEILDFLVMNDWIIELDSFRLLTFTQTFQKVDFMSMQQPDQWE